VKKRLGVKRVTEEMEKKDYGEEKDPPTISLVLYLGKLTNGGVQNLKGGHTHF